MVSNSLLYIRDGKKWRGEDREDSSALYMLPFFAIFSLPYRQPVDAATQAMNIDRVSS